MLSRGPSYRANGLRSGEVIIRLHSIVFQRRWFHIGFRVCGSYERVPYHTFQK